MKKKYLFGSMIVFSCFALGIFGNACGRPFDVRSEKEISSTQVRPAGLPEAVVYPNTKTAAMVYGNQILDHLLACAGVASPSDGTLTVWRAKKGSISETGAYDSITAPMLMAVTSIAGEVCNDLVEIEAAVGGDQRRIFNIVDFDSDRLSAGFDESLRKLARSCWLREETDEEKSFVMNGMSQYFTPAAGVNKKAALSLCTQVLASLDTLLL